MKKLAIIFLVCFSVLLAVPPVGTGEPGNTAPCAYPPFLTQNVMPNVLIIFDNSGSMNWPAYVDTTSSSPEVYDYGSYDPNRRYYGYAEPDSYYVYNDATKRFEYTTNWGTSTDADPAHKRFKGNFLNWLMSRRIDISRKVFVGGKVQDRSVPGPKTLIWEDPVQSRYFYKYWWCDDGCRWRFYNSYYDYVKAYRRSSCTSGSYSYKWTAKKKIIGPENPHGFIQNTANRIRYAIMHFNNDQGGRIYEWMGADVDDLVDDIENIGCNTWTPLAESFYEGTRFFQATTGYYNSVNYASHDPIEYWCQKNYVILITDGESTQDRDIPSWLRDYDGDGDDPVPPGKNPNVYPWASDGSDYLDDVALWAHTNDLRSDFTGMQNLTLYTIYTFGQSRDAIEILQRAAINGAFEDRNGNLIPDLQVEWDVDGDSVPDAYFGAEDGYLLEAALIQVFIDLMRNVSSASGVSVVTTSTKGEGTIFQALFSPSKFTGSVQLDWTGDLHALWVDPWGNFREDTDHDKKLDLKTDYIVQIRFHSDRNQTLVHRFEDDDGDGEIDDTIDAVDPDYVNSVWRAGSMLLTKDADDRRIMIDLPCATLASVDSTTPIPVDSPPVFNLIDFTPSDDMKKLRKLFDVETPDDVDSLVRFIRGEDFKSIYWRQRTIGTNVWKLGDIIHSSPTFVGAPKDRYDLVYGDRTYRQFYRRYKDREGRVYVGSNSGMIHAFNAGRYHERSDPYVRGYLDPGSYDLGEEVWAIIPFSVIPHLKWLTDPEYCHVYYVDSKSKAFDARVFPTEGDTVHPNGWGTILIMGLRFGGTPYNLGWQINHWRLVPPSIFTETSFPVAPAGTVVTTNQLNSSFICLDVTIPDTPRVLWELWDPLLGYTVNYPAVAKVGDKWFFISGSGPTDLDGFSSHKAIFFALNVADPSDGALFISEHDNAHSGEAMPVDVDVDGNVDVIYYGCSYYSGGSWHGRIYRVTTGSSDDPTTWSLSVLMDVPAPVTAPGAATVDPQGNLWLYFGTGRYFSNIDEADFSQQYIFALKDSAWSDGSETYRFADLYDVTDFSVQLTDTGTYVYSPTIPDGMIYDSLVVRVLSSRGWVRRLRAGERVITRPLVIGEVVFFASFIPDEDICSFGGTSYLYGLDYLTGVPGRTSILGASESGWLYTSVELGEGVPSAPAAHIGVTDKAAISVQLSTGIISTARASVRSPKSGTIFWRGK